LNIEQAAPIFILGIMPRSGTNFLWDLLCLHPDCAPGRPPIREDFFLEASDHLLGYTSAVRAWWDPNWGHFDDVVMDEFHRSLGDGLISFLWVDRDRRLVTKTPSVRHLDRFFRFFPNAYLIILVRDGRSVAQSAMASFGWDLDRAARQWAEAAETIRSFTGQRRHGNERSLIVRYEDVFRDPKGHLQEVLRFLDLDEHTFDFHSAATLPVRGSSFYFGPGRDSLHWEPVTRGSNFDPTETWRTWTREMHERFEWLAGEQLRYLGYESYAPRVDRWSRVVQHRAMDWGWYLRTSLQRFHSRLWIKLATMSRPLRQRFGLIRESRDARARNGQEAPE
jgi:hypothetical protein